MDSTWVLSSPESQAWETLFRDAITVSGDAAIVTEHLISQYFQGRDVENWYLFHRCSHHGTNKFERHSIIAVLGFLLTCAHEHGSSPTDELLSTVDVCLTVCYSRACHSPEVLTHSLRLLNVVRHVIISGSDNVMHILRALGSSLCLWIEDHSEVMCDDEFNAVVWFLFVDSRHT